MKYSLNISLNNTPQNVIVENIFNQTSTSSGVLMGSSLCETTVSDMEYVASLIGDESDESEQYFAVELADSMVDIEAVKICTN